MTINLQSMIPTNTEQFLQGQKNQPNNWHQQLNKIGELERINLTTLGNIN